MCSPRSPLCSQHLPQADSKVFSVPTWAEFWWFLTKCLCLGILLFSTKVPKRSEHIVVTHFCLRFEFQRRPLLSWSKGRRLSHSRTLHGPQASQNNPCNWAHLGFTNLSCSSFWRRGAPSYVSTKHHKLFCFAGFSAVTKLHKTTAPLFFVFGLLKSLFCWKWCHFFKFLDRSSTFIRALFLTILHPAQACCFSFCYFPCCFNCLLCDQKYLGLQLRMYYLLLWKSA